MQETRTCFQSKRKRMTQKFWEGRGDKAKTKQVAEMNRFNLAKTEWLSCSLILPCSSVGALNASPPTGEWSRQVNSAQLHPVPRWIKGENTDTPTSRKENKQVGKRREKKKGWAPTVWLVQIGLGCFSSLLSSQRWLGCGWLRVLLNMAMSSHWTPVALTVCHHVWTNRTLQRRGGTGD